jgi:class 3 adenylate cyclase
MSVAGHRPAILLYTIQLPQAWGCILSEERRLAAILAADVAGYSRLMGTDEEGTLAHLKSFRRTLIDPKITAHRQD